MSRAIFEALSGGKTILDAADSAADNTIVVPAVTGILPVPTTVGLANQVLTSSGTTTPTWKYLAGTGTVTSINGSGGSTGLTLTGGPITVAGTLTLGGLLNATYGGTGASNLVGYMFGNGPNPASASLTIPNTSISGLGTMSTQAATAVAITGGTINGTSIGATTRSSGDFTTLSGNAVSSTTPVLSFNASNTIASFGSTTASSYNQLVIQNQSNSAGASANYVVSNNLGTDSTYYAEFGMNSSTFSASTPADFYSINNGIYYSGHDGDVSIGSGNGFKTYLTYGTTGQSSHVINASGALGFTTNLGTTPALSGTTGFGTAGQYLVSAGSAAPPAWATLSLVSPPPIGTTTPAEVRATTGWSQNFALTDAATVAWDTTNQTATFTFVSTNRTFGAPTNLKNGAFYALAIIQNAGSNTLTWNAVFKWTGGVAPTLSTAASAKDYFVFRSDGTNLYEQGRSLGVA
jgi:hypothetical protein